MQGNFDGKVKNIKVSALEQKTISNGSVMTKITDSEGMKYSFFNLKKDGNPTAASVGFKGQGIGDTVEIGYKEEEKSFTSKEDGRDVKYTQRTILFANPVHENGNYPVDPSLGKPPTIEHGNIQDIVIDSSDIPF
jgi:hypothetical protein